MVDKLIDGLIERDTQIGGRLGGRGMMLEWKVGTGR